MTTTAPPPRQPLPYAQIPSFYATRCDITNPSCDACLAHASALAYRNDPHRIPLRWALPLLDPVLDRSFRSVEIDLGPPAMPSVWREQQSLSTLSKSAACLRQVSFRALGAPVTNPVTPAKAANMRHGTVLHALSQAMIAAGMADTHTTRLEAPVDHPIETLIPFGLDPADAATLRAAGICFASRGCLDLLSATVDGDDSENVELKFPKATPWVCATGQGSKHDLEPVYISHEGPSVDHITQVTMGVFAPNRWTLKDDGDRHNPDHWQLEENCPPLTRGVLLYGAKSPSTEPTIRRMKLSPGDELYAEWAYTTDQLRPFYEAEMRRLARVATDLAAGRLAPRRQPEENWPARASDELSTTEAYGFDYFGKGIYDVWERTTATGTEEDIWIQAPETGEMYKCTMCAYQKLCALNPGRVVDANGIPRAETLTVDRFWGMVTQWQWGTPLETKEGDHR